MNNAADIAPLQDNLLGCTLPQYRIKTLYVTQIPRRAEKQGAGRPGLKKQKKTLLLLWFGVHTNTLQSFKTHIFHLRRDVFSNYRSEMRLFFHAVEKQTPKDHQPFIRTFLKLRGFVDSIKWFLWKRKPHLCSLFSHLRPFFFLLAPQ